MKQILHISIMATTFLFGGNYTTDQASNYIGENATVCGIVTGGHYAKSSGGQPTFINLDGVYPNHKFTIVIWGENRHKFSSPERRYNDKKVCVSGVIDTYKGTPQIVIKERSQLE